MTRRDAENPSSPPGVPTLAVGDIVELFVTDTLAADSRKGRGGTAGRESGHSVLPTASSP